MVTASRISPRSVVLESPGCRPPEEGPSNLTRANLLHLLTPQGRPLCRLCPARSKDELAVGLRLAFGFRSRLSERKFEPRHRSNPGKCLMYRPEIGWVPNGRGEQPERKPGVRERFRASGRSSRCTAIHEKPPNSWAFQGRSADGETVRMGNVGGGRGTVVKPSSVIGLRGSRAPSWHRLRGWSSGRVHSSVRGRRVRPPQAGVR